MPERIDSDELAFLRRVDEGLESGLTISEVADREGVAPGTITYRLARRGLRVETTARVVDRRSGQSLHDLLRSGIFVTDEAPLPVAA